MNREEIIRMAREAGFSGYMFGYWDDYEVVVSADTIERFAALVAAAEREACAKVCEAGTGEPIQMKTLEILRKERERIAAAIRARGQQ